MNKLITISDLLRMSEHPKYLGFGYIGHPCRDPDTYADLGDSAHTAAASVDMAVVDLANAHGWSVEELFTWANSAYGRRCGDAISCAADLNEIEAAIDDSMEAFESEAD